VIHSLDINDPVVFVYSKSCATITRKHLRTFSSPSEAITHRLTQHPSCRQQLPFLSLCLVWTLRISWIIQYVVFVNWLFKCIMMFSGYGCTAFWIYKNHWIVYVQWVNHLVYELYLKKAIIKKKQKRSMGWNVLELNGWELSVFLTLKSMKSEANSLRLHRNNILHHLAIFSKCLYEQRMCQFYSFSTVGLLDLSHPNYKAVLSFGPLEYQTPLQPPKVYSALFLLF